MRQVVGHLLGAMPGLPEFRRPAVLPDPRSPRSRQCWTEIRVQHLQLLPLGAYVIVH